MTEFEKQVPKEGFQSAKAKFMGYASEPKKGKGKKGDWRIAKTRWLLEGKQNENKFVIFSPMTSKKTKYTSDSDLSQWEWYHIVWVEEEQTYNGNTWVQKKIVIINDTDVDNANDELEQGDNDTGVQLPDMAYVEKLVKAYNKKVPQEINTVNHFIGTVLKTYLKDKVDYIEEVYNRNRPEEEIKE